MDTDLSLDQDLLLFGSSSGLFNELFDNFNRLVDLSFASVDDLLVRFDHFSYFRSRLDGFNGLDGRLFGFFGHFVFAFFDLLLELFACFHASQELIIYGLFVLWSFHSVHLMQQCWNIFLASFKVGFFILTSLLRSDRGDVGFSADNHDFIILIKLVFDGLVSVLEFLDYFGDLNFLSLVLGGLDLLDESIDLMSDLGDFLMHVSHFLLEDILDNHSRSLLVDLGDLVSQLVNNSLHVSDSLMDFRDFLGVVLDVLDSLNQIIGIN